MQQSNCFHNTRFHTVTKHISSAIGTLKPEHYLWHQLLIKAILKLTELMMISLQQIRVVIVFYDETVMM